MPSREVWFAAPHRSTWRLVRASAVLVGLYEEPERPPNAVDYIKRYMGAPNGIDVSDDRWWERSRA